MEVVAIVLVTIAGAPAAAVAATMAAMMDQGVDKPSNIAHVLICGPAQ
jgi:hypothetical protein